MKMCFLRVNKILTQNIPSAQYAFLTDVVTSENVHFFEKAKKRWSEFSSDFLY